MGRLCSRYGQAHRKRHNYIQKHKHHVTDIVYMRERELKEGGERPEGGSGMGRRERILEATESEIQGWRKKGRTWEGGRESYCWTKTAVTGVPKFALRWRLERMYGNCMQLFFLSKRL